MLCSYGAISIAAEWLQNLGLCPAFRSFEQGGILIVPHLMWRGTLVYVVVPPLLDKHVVLWTHWIPKMNWYDDLKELSFNEN